jgi:1,4-alpha-glucan branching enzyme
MERYHFKTDDQSDARGVELASLAAAKCEAGKVMASMVCESADEPWQRSEWTVTVTDDRGVKVLQLQIVGTEVHAVG